MKTETIQFQRYRFWITGERQFEDEKFVDIRVDYPKEEIRGWVEEWVHSLWHSCSMIKYGYEPFGYPFDKHQITIDEKELSALLNVPITDRIDSLYVYDKEVIIMTLPAFMSRTSDI